MYPITLDGPTLYLREYREDDLDAALAVLGDPEVSRYLVTGPPNRAQQARQLAGDLERARQVPRADYSLATVERATGDVVGAGRLALDNPPHGEVAYSLRRDRWGRGYGTELLALLLSFGFDTLGLHRIQATVAPENAASLALLAKFGFTYEGRIRRDVLHEGRWRDSLLYSLLEDEWALVEADFAPVLTAG